MWTDARSLATLVPVDPELRALLSALAEGQIKLAESQARLETAEADTRGAIAVLTKSHAQLAQSHAQLAQSHARLEESHARLETAMVETREDLKGFSARMERYTQEVARGFTTAAARDGDIKVEVEALKARVDALEKRNPPPSAPKVRRKG
jgi:septal ring factor EnvC (AmiA/AmiB activator)